jgi:hypothetical protein
MARMRHDLRPFENEVPRPRLEGMPATVAGRAPGDLPTWFSTFVDGGHD